MFRRDRQRLTQLLGSAVVGNDRPWNPGLDRKHNTMEPGPDDKIEFAYRFHPGSRIDEAGPIFWAELLEFLFTLLRCDISPNLFISLLRNIFGLIAANLDHIEVMLSDIDAVGPLEHFHELAFKSRQLRPMRQTCRHGDTIRRHS